MLTAIIALSTFSVAMAVIVLLLRNEAVFLIKEKKMLEDHVELYKSKIKLNINAEKCIKCSSAMDCISTVMYLPEERMIDVPAHIKEQLLFICGTCNTVNLFRIKLIPIETQ